jgi:hypothetical protein
MRNKQLELMAREQDLSAVDEKLAEEAAKGAVEDA